MLGACSSGSNSAGSGAQTTEIQLSALGVNVPDMSATLEIAGMETYTMTVNADYTVSAMVEGITPGLHTITATYYSDDIVLAKASKFVDFVAGQDVSITLTSEDIDQNFDDDFDGWTNLAEILWGSEPLFATSSPPSESPEVVLSATGGQAISASYTLQDTLGEAVGTDTGSSLNYTLAGGFQAYH